MTLEQLRKDMMQAMKDRDKPRKEAISSLVSAVKKAGIDAGVRDNIPEEMVDQTILKEQRLAKESLEDCPDSREDLKKEYQFRYDIISEYAPKMMTEAEIRSALTSQYADILATGNKGLIMKTVMPVFKGKADGKLINQIVAELTK